MAEIDVPDAEQSHEHRQIVAPRRTAEVLVHLMPAAQEGEEIVAADRDSERYADGRPHGVAAANPIPHLEAVVRMHAEGIHGLVVDGHRGEMLAHRLLAEL